jgi:glutamine amidotransferase PdxT
VARDAAGNQKTSAAISVTVNNSTGDTTAPAVSISAPASGATVSGISATVTADASDNISIAGVQFKVDGANYGSEDTVAPYTISWNTTTVSNGTHSITALARDAAGNQKTSTAVSVTVNNATGDTTPPSVSISAPAAGASVNGASVTVSANASDNGSISGVQFKLNGANVGSEDTVAPYSISWNTTTVFNGTHSITAVARDAAGNQKTSAAVSVTVNNNTTGDTTPPSVSISAPSSGATVSGRTNTITVTASDNVRVVGVQFQIDGVDLGSEDTSAPFRINWYTLSTPDGWHTITAVARDAAGNKKTSAAVQVRVNIEPCKLAGPGALGPACHHLTTAFTLVSA